MLLLLLPPRSLLRVVAVSYNGLRVRLIVLILDMLKN